MARQHRKSEDESRYWRTRTVLEFIRVAVEIAWDFLRSEFPF